MNLKLQKRSRRPVRVGDVFAFQPPNDTYMFGRVISDQVKLFSAGFSIMIYVYDVSAAQKVPPLSELTTKRLLFPPVLINRLPWSKGYLETVGNWELSPTERFEQHCFRDIRGYYFDENGQRLETPSPPIGHWGLDSYQTLDDKISSALRIPCSGIARSS